MATRRWLIYVDHDDDHDSGGPSVARQGSTYAVPGALKVAAILFIMVATMIFKSDDN